MTEYRVTWENDKVDAYLTMLSERQAYFAKSARHYRDNPGVGDAYLDKHRIFTVLNWAEDHAYRMREAIRFQEIAARAYAERAAIMGEILK